MFTGLVEEVGIVRRVSTIGENKILEIKTSLELATGDSLSVSGVCLTVTEKGNGWVKVEATEKTVGRTTLRDVYAETRVNLERALTLSKPLGGHLVQGHVDEVGKITGIHRTEDACKIEVVFSREFSELVVDQGSVAIDGVSLTVLEKKNGPKLSVNVIPETLRRTTLGERRVSDKVNLEYDLLAKYVRENVRSRI